MTRQLTPQQAYERLADRAAGTEICSAEAYSKLRDWGIDADKADAIVDRLIAQRPIDDRRFAHAYVRDRINNARWGLLKIRQAMRLKRIPSALVNEAIDSELNDETYCSNLAAALRSKARSMPSPIQSADRAKLIRFAASRGYEPELIMQMLSDEYYWRTAD